MQNAKDFSLKEDLEGVFGRVFRYPYFANNIFLMRRERYVRVIQHEDCCRGTDERMMNQLRLCRS